VATAARASTSARAYSPVFSSSHAVRAERFDFAAVAAGPSRSTAAFADRSQRRALS